MSAVSTVFTVGQWIVQSQKKLYYIEVESRGNTFESARDQAFRLAVEQAVGTLVLSETETTQSRLRRDEIVTYASGYVDRYEITERKVVHSSHHLRLRVWVTHSAIAGRLFHQESRPQEVSGQNISAQLQTLRHQQQSADRLLNTVMRDYPQRALEVSLEPAGVRLDNQRQAHLQVPFVLSWSKSYLKALEETLAAINQYPACANVLADCSQARSHVQLQVNNFVKDPGAWFNDDQAWQVMFANMVTTALTYRLTLTLDSGKQQIYCFPARELDGNEYRSRYFVNFGSGRVRVNGQHWDRILLSVPLTNLPVENFSKVSVDVVRQNHCR
jgi:hypothetical protein